MTTPPANPSPPTERNLFLAALELPPEERAAHLAQACAGDHDLRRRVEQLLQEQLEVGSFLDQPALAATHLAPHTAQVHEKAGDRIGRYRLLQLIGEGGCGLVFMADQEEPVRRRVALKIIKLGMDTRSVIARFEAERQAVALMDHPNIARVFDAGTTETGRPYFVMELVRGSKLTEYCDQNQLPTPERLALFIQVCQAVQHAHQKGIIHRDLKPSNILVTLHDGVPVPKIIDFGIAKATEQRLTDKTFFTEFAAFIGTPAYMSPEQAEMSGLDIDTRSDIYSLGVLLYELLTGRTPFDAEALLRGGIDACRRTIRETEPARPSTRLHALAHAELTTTASQRRTDAPRLVHLLQGDLDWIVMKCLEKDRTRRYPTANALANDLQRYLENEPVLARPPSNLYRLGKLLRRHRIAVGATTGIALALIAGAGLSLWQAVRATQAEKSAELAREQEALLRRIADAKKEDARLNVYVADMNLAQQSMAAGNYGRAVQLLEKHRPDPGERDLRGFEWRYLWLLSRGNEHIALPSQGSSILGLALSPDGQRLAVGLRDETRLLNPTTGERLLTLPHGSFSLAFLPDNKTLVAANRSVVRVWNSTDGSDLRHFTDQSGPVALSGDGHWLATQGPEGVVIRRTADWSELRRLPASYGPLAFAPDNATLATDSRRGLMLWPLAETHPPLVLADSTNLFHRGGPFRMTHGFAFSRDGRFLVAARNPPSARGVFVLNFWETTLGQEAGVLPADPERPEHTGVISALAFSPDGKFLATASFDHSIRLWDFPNRKFSHALQGHMNEVWALAFSADGTRLVSGAKDGGINVWALHPKPAETFLPNPWAPLAFSRQPRSVAAYHPEGTVGFFSPAARDPDREIHLDLSRPAHSLAPDAPPGPSTAQPTNRSSLAVRPQGDPSRGGLPPPLALSADLRLLAHGRPDGTVHLWDTTTQEVHPLKVADGRVDWVALSPDGRVLVTGGWERPLAWFEVGGPTNALLTIDAQRGFFSPDGRLFAALPRGNTVQIWDVARRTLRNTLTLDPAPGFLVAFSPDSETLATTSGIDDFDNGIHLWDAATGRSLGSCAGHKQPVWSVAFTADGRTLASSGADGTIKLWSVAARQELLSMRHPGSTPRNLMFSPDGELLVGSPGPFPSGTAGPRVLRAPSLADIDRADRERLTAR